MEDTGSMRCQQSAAWRCSKLSEIAATAVPAVGNRRRRPTQCHVGEQQILRPSERFAPSSSPRYALLHGSYLQFIFQRCSFVPLLLLFHFLLFLLFLLVIGPTSLLGSLDGSAHQIANNWWRRSGGWLWIRSSHGFQITKESILLVFIIQI